MAKATYLGPGDAVELDGLRFERGKSYPMTNEQVARVRASDPHAGVDVTENAAETALEVARILDSQAQLRDSALDHSEREARKAADEAAKLQEVTVARSQKAAADREAARAEAAQGPRTAKRGGKESN